MSYEKNIEIYKIIGNINTPLESNGSKIADCSIGDYLVIIEDIVWIRDWNDQREE